MMNTNEPDNPNQPNGSSNGESNDGGNAGRPQNKNRSESGSYQIVENQADESNLFGSNGFVPSQGVLGSEERKTPSSGVREHNFRKMPNARNRLEV